MPSVPFFNKFTKRTEGYFREGKPHKEKYNLGQRVEFSGTLADCKECKLGAKFDNNPDRTLQKFELELAKSWGKLKLIENSCCGNKSAFKVEAKIPKLYGNFGLETKHSNNNAEVELNYNPETYYNAKFKGMYKADGGRLCTTTSFACGDDSLKLNVGGQISISDQADDKQELTRSFGIESYKLGFLYEPTNDSSYSVIYTPDAESNGLNFDLQCFKELNERLSVATKVVGKVDINKARGGRLPVLSMAAKYQVAENSNVQGFASSNSEYGLAYSTRIDSAKFTFGYSNYLTNGSLNSKAGFKLEI